MKVLHHCWHDASVKFPSARPIPTLDAPTAQGRVCCYCGETSAEPLPPLPPMRSHGPYVDDDSEWYVLDDADCPGLSIVKLNVDPVVVPIDIELE